MRSDAKLPAVRVAARAAIVGLPPSSGSAGSKGTVPCVRQQTARTLERLPSPSFGRERTGRFGQPAHAASAARVALRQPCFRGALTAQRDRRPAPVHRARGCRTRIPWIQMERSTEMGGSHGAEISDVTQVRRRCSKPHSKPQTHSACEPGLAVPREKCLTKAASPRRVLAACHTIARALLDNSSHGTLATDEAHEAHEAARTHPARFRGGKEVVAS